jgi:hypothetical protein
MKETKMNTKLSTTQRIRALIHKGYNNKDIVAKLGCKPQAVYNIRYQMNKERGLGSIGALPKPTNGIGAPPKRKYTRKVKAGTGITAPEPVINPAQNMYPQAGEWVDRHAPGSITMVEPKPTLWQRVKGWFRG